jgi:tRNA(Ile)-lysidine synthase
VVLLDMLAKKPDLELIVAHFDHGIRDDSHEDAEFVTELAKKYDLPIEIRREELGTNASEDLARTRRYKFLRELAKKYNAQIVTAHHSDDAVETIAINLSRGTGWRGLAVLDSDIIRPLTNRTKAEILEYAQKHKLNWHEDSTNTRSKYLRNQIRKKMTELDDDEKQQLLALVAEQKSLKRLICEEAAILVGDGPNYSRYFFTHIDSDAGMECLRHITGARLTRPQLAKTLHIIKTIMPGKVYLAGGGVKINFTSRNFTVELLK